MIVESYEDVIILSGALRSNFWETIHTAIALTLKRHPTGVIMDCSGITECTVEGADTFVDVMHFIEDQDARIIVAAVPEHVLEVLKRVPEVRSQLPISPSVEDARKSIDLLVKGEEERPSKKKLQQNPSLRKFLLCLSGDASDEELVNVSREIAGPALAEVCLIFPVIVPRELPIQSPLPELEAQAKAALEKAQANLTKAEISNSIRIERARDVASAIRDALEEMDANQVFVSLPTDSGSLDGGVKLVKSVMSLVRKPVLFVRGSTE